MSKKLYKRTPLPDSENELSAKLDFGTFRCRNVKLMSSEGGSGLVYSAISDDYYGLSNAAPAHLIVKECYPREIENHLFRDETQLCFRDDAPKSAKERFTRYLERFRNAFITQTLFYQSPIREQITPPHKAIFANGTAYTVSDASNGESFAAVVDDLALPERLDVLLQLCKTLAAMHDQGYLYLDLKPSNVLVLRTSSGIGVKLFDFDTVLPLKKMDTPIASGGSLLWSAPEQRTTRLTGRPPLTNEIIHADGEWAISSENVKGPLKSDIDNDGIQIINSILSQTLVIDREKRYGSLSELHADLDELARLTNAKGRARTEGQRTTSLRSATLKKEPSILGEQEERRGNPRQQKSRTKPTPSEQPFTGEHKESRHAKKWSVIVGALLGALCIIALIVALFVLSKKTRSLVDGAFSTMFTKAKCCPSTT